MEVMTDLPRFQLSFPQQRLWLLEEMEGAGSILYNVPVALQLNGPLDLGALELSLGGVLRRHGALRATFQMNSRTGLPEQVIRPWSRFRLSVKEVDGSCDQDRKSRIRDLVRQENQRAFNLRTGPLFRAVLLRVSPDFHVLSIVLHHIVADGWSIGVLIREIAIFYEARSLKRGKSPLPELPIQYVDYANWQRKRVTSQSVHRQVCYWRDQLKEPLPVLRLPARGPRPALYDGRGAEKVWRFAEGITNRLKDFSRREGATLFMTLAAAFKVLLNRYSGQKDILIGTPIANRNRPEVEGLIGVFVNTLVLRTELSGDPTFRELLGRVKTGALDAYANQDVPFEMLVEELQPERDLSANPFFQVLFVLQNSPGPPLRMAEITMSPIIVEGTTAKFDVTLAVMESDEDRLSGWLEYNTSIFDEQFIDQMARHYESILRGIVVDPDQRISEIDILGPEERRRLLSEWNETQAAGPALHCLHHLFEAQVESTPDGIALVCEDDFLSYSELDSRADQLAHYLQEAGIGPEVRVGICTNRSLQMVIGLMGILKAGGAYVPLDAEYPMERLTYILDDANVEVVITTRDLLTTPDIGSRRCIFLEGGFPALHTNSVKTIGGVNGENLSHIIYTSGSTGKPKGVAIEHRNASEMVCWAIRAFGRDRLDGTLASTSICFDLSVFEIFVSLSCGGKVILANNALGIREIPSAGAITLINTVPSAMAAILNDVPRSVRTINLAGEALKRALVNSIYEGTGAAEVFNLYGPSEDTTYSTFALIRRNESGNPAIGRPISNTRAYLLDEHLNPVPPWVIGDLYLGGRGLARGYFNLPGLTAEKFIPNPYAEQSGNRLYSTGDSARYLFDANIDFLGRADHQVKIRGFRIEMGEIETVLGAHPGVKESVVLAREDKVGDLRLIAYLTLKQAPQVDEESRDDERLAVAKLPASVLRAYLAGRLPSYMIPSAFVILDQMPLTLNGKVDRKALAAAGQPGMDREVEYQPPRSELEEDLAKIFSEVLEIDKVGINDNFFLSGGHSLLATKVVTLIRETLRIEIPLRRVFEAPTVAGLAESIQEVRELQGEGGVAADIQASIGPRAAPVEEVLLSKLDQLSDQELETLLAELDGQKDTMLAS